MRPFGLTPPRLTALVSRIMRSAWKAGGPYKVVLCATHRCSCRCRFCGIWSRKTPEMPAAALVSQLARLPSLAWVDLTGGEIFAREDYQELCHGLASHLPGLALFHFPTAGQHPKEAVGLARQMAGFGLRTVVTVSLDGPPAIHDHLRGIPGAWNSALETFLLLRREPGVDVFIGSTLVPENLLAIPMGLFASVQSVVPDIRPDEFHINVMQRSQHYFANDDATLPDRAETRKALGRFLRFKGIPRGPFDLLELAYQAIAWGAVQGAPTPRCRALQASLFVGPDGTVQPCHIWDRPLGRLGEDGNLDSLLKSPEARSIRREIVKRQCAVCWTPCEAYPTLFSALASPLTGKS